MFYAAANLLSMGLELQLDETIRVLRNPRLTLYALFWTWAVGPAVAWLIARALPLHPGYVVGLFIFSLAPTAPLLPLLIRKARADMPFAAALMPLAVVGTVVMMPLLAPLLIPGLAVSAGALAKPLVLTILLPLLAGVATTRYAPAFSRRVFPAVKRTAGISTLLLLVGALGLYAREFVAALGTYAIAAQVLFVLAMALASYLLSSGFTQAQRSSLALGVCSRNGAAMFVAMTAFPTIDPKLMVMILLAIPAPTITWFVIARVLAARARAAEAPAP